MKLAIIIDKCVEFKEDPDPNAQIKRWLEETKSNDSKLELISSAIEMHDPDLLIGPEYFFMNGRNALDLNGKKEILRDLKKMSAGKKVTLIPGTMTYIDGAYSNSTFVISNGKVRKEVKKRAYSGFDEYFYGRYASDYHQSSGFGPNIENYLKNHLIEIKGLKLLIEVCADHPLTVRRSDGERSYSFFRRKNITFDPVPVPKVADLQIVLSNESNHHFTFPIEKLFLKPRGYFIESNSEKPSAYVGRVIDGKMENVYTSRSKLSRVVVLNLSLR